MTEAPAANTTDTTTAPPADSSRALVAASKASLITRTGGDIATLANGALQRSAVQPQNIAEMTALAQILATAGIVQIPIPRSQDTRNAEPGEILALIMTGADMGLSAMQSVRGLYVIGGKAGAYVKMLHAMVRAHPLCQELRPVYTGRDRAVWFAWRKGDTEGSSFEYTWEDAETAELTTKAMWRKNPRRMLSARALGEAIQMTWPDVIQGLGNADEIMEGLMAEWREPDAETVRRREEEARGWGAPRAVPDRGPWPAHATPRMEEPAPPAPAKAPPGPTPAKAPPGPTPAELHAAFLDKARSAGARSKAEIQDAAIEACDQADLAALTEDQRAQVLARITQKTAKLTTPEKAEGARSVLAEARGGHEIAPPMADVDIPF